jgi:hypothetical protein
MNWMQFEGDPDIPSYLLCLFVKLYKTYYICISQKNKKYMKKVILFFTALLMIGVAKGQSNKEEVDMLQSMFGKEKKQMVGDFLKVEPAKADAFWKVYDEYEAARKDLGKQRIDLLKSYANNYNSMAPEVADKWMSDVLKVQSATDKLVVTYYKKVKKVTDSVTALKFYHIENYILGSIRLGILEEIPFAEKKK